MAKKPQTKLVPQPDGALEIIEQPPYTWEEVIAVKDYLSSFTKTEEGRLSLIDFNEKYFGEKIIGYCDQACVTRVRKRLDIATQKLNEWESKKNNPKS